MAALSDDGQDLHGSMEVIVHSDDVPESDTTTVDVVGEAMARIAEPDMRTRPGASLLRRALQGARSGWGPD